MIKNWEQERRFLANSGPFSVYVVDASDGTYYAVYRESSSAHPGTQVTPFVKDRMLMMKRMRDEWGRWREYMASRRYDKSKYRIVNTMPTFSVERPRSLTSILEDGYDPGVDDNDYFDDYDDGP